MNKISKLVAVLLVALTGQATYADTVVPLDAPISGIPTGSSPWMTATFQDVLTGGVQLNLAAGTWPSNATQDIGFYFNFYDGIGGSPLSSLSFAHVGGDRAATTITALENSLSPIGTVGSFDIRFVYGGFKSAETSTYLITTNSGAISALSFTNILSNSTAGYGLAAQNKTGSADFYYAANGFSAPAPVPEAETYAMLLAGLGLMGWIARRRTRQVAVD